MIHNYIQSLSEDPKYAIGGYEIVGDDVTLFVREITSAQSEIPKMVDGKKITVLKLA